MNFVHTIVLATVVGDVVIMGTPSAAVSALLSPAGDICCRYLCTFSGIVSVSILSIVTKGCCISKCAMGVSVYNKKVHLILKKMKSIAKKCALCSYLMWKNLHLIHAVIV